MVLDTRDAALRGRIGAFRLHATHDPKETTHKARAAFLEKFEREVDPDGTLPPEERARRAEAARKAHMAKLAYQSAKTRRQRGQRKSRQRALTAAEVRDAGAAPSS